MRSNATSGQNGLVYGINYNFTANDTVAVTLHRLAANASPEGLGGYDNDTKVVKLEWGHTVGQAGTLTISYDRAKTLSDGTGDKTTSIEYNSQF